MFLLLARAEADYRCQNCKDSFHNDVELQFIDARDISIVTHKFRFSYYSGCALMLGFFSLPYSAKYINRANLEGKLFLVKVFSLDIYEGEYP